MMMVVGILLIAAAVKIPRKPAGREISRKELHLFRKINGSMKAKAEFVEADADMLSVDQKSAAHNGATSTAALLKALFGRKTNFRPRKSLSARDIPVVGSVPMSQLKHGVALRQDGSIFSKYKL